MGETFEDFVRGCAHRLYRVACLLASGDLARAEDLVAEALARVYLVWPRLNHGDAYGYARRTLVNLYTDWWRIGLRRREVVTDRPPDRGTAGDPAGEIVHRDSVARSRRRLTRRERAVVVLRYFLDLTERETAAELGISVGTVKLYAGTQQSITIDVNGREAPVSALWNDPTGWTIFCDERRLPPPVEDDVDAPGTRPPVTVRFNVYDGSTRLLSQAAMPGIDIVLLGGRPTCTG